MTEHHDVLEALNEQRPLQEKLVAAHESMKKLFPFVVRIAVAIYDPGTKVLKSFLHSGEDGIPKHTQILLDEAPSLKALLEKGLPRVINNLLTFEEEGNAYTQRIGRSGYAASYTLPMFNDGEFFGFIFFNANERDVFNEKALSQLDIFGHVISLMVINELNAIHMLTVAIKTTGHMTHHRDPETGSHLDRMSRYSLIIARTLADQYGLDDDFIQHLFMFAPLHDIGKIAIPDNILLKEGSLDEDEVIVMKSHAQKGREMIDELIKDFGLHDVQHIELLRNIASYHHEAINGSGYPEGRKGEDIPIEARIVAVADVFDALTSRRPYKEAWTNDHAIEVLRNMAGEKLDHNCVEALIAHLDEVEAIQHQFKENLYS
ncbi:MAG: HD domain-containing protein [Gammaproteobacteria bacterium]|nr:MAG: HD domain-containing protein [Gammaproteobacteria bacterium]